jgi:hypothetical protein
LLDCAEERRSRKDYLAAIVDAVTSAQMIVGLIAQHSVVPRHVLSEAGHAFNAGKRTPGPAARRRTARACSLGSSRLRTGSWTGHRPFLEATRQRAEPPLTKDRKRKLTQLLNSFAATRAGKH